MGNSRATTGTDLCDECGLPYQKTRTWHRFCSSTCRITAWQKINEPGAQAICEYCGMPGDSVDHVPPKVTRQKLIDLGIADRYPFCEVTACRECNSALGCRPLWTVSARRKFVKTWLRRRYKKLLSIPDWTDRELLDLGPAMQRYVIDSLTKRDIIDDRIRWPGFVG
jgi:hypothetical protein